MYIAPIIPCKCNEVRYTCTDNHYTVVSCITDSKLLVMLFFYRPFFRIFCQCPIGKSRTCTCTCRSYMWFLFSKLHVPYLYFHSGLLHWFLNIFHTTAFQFIINLYLGPCTCRSYMWFLFSKLHVPYLYFHSGLLHWFLNIFHTTAFQFIMNLYLGPPNYPFLRNTAFFIGWLVDLLITVETLVIIIAIHCICTMLNFMSYM